MREEKDSQSIDGRSAENVPTEGSNGESLVASRLACALEECRQGGESWSLMRLASGWDSFEVRISVGEGAQRWTVERKLPVEQMVLARFDLPADHVQAMYYMLRSRCDSR